MSEPVKAKLLRPRPGTWQSIAVGLIGLGVFCLGIGGFLYDHVHSQHALHRTETQDAKIDANKTAIIATINTAVTLEKRIQALDLQLARVIGEESRLPSESPRERALQRKLASSLEHQVREIEELQVTGSPQPSAVGGGSGAPPTARPRSRSSSSPAAPHPRTSPRLSPAPTRSGGS